MHRPQTVALLWGAVLTPATSLMATARRPQLAPPGLHLVCLSTRPPPPASEALSTTRYRPPRRLTARHLDALTAGIRQQLSPSVALGDDSVDGGAGGARKEGDAVADVFEVRMSMGSRTARVFNSHLPKDGPVEPRAPMPTSALPLTSPPNTVTVASPAGGLPLRPNSRPRLFFTVRSGRGIGRAVEQHPDVLVLQSSPPAARPAPSMATTQTAGERLALCSAMRPSPTRTGPDAQTDGALVAAVRQHHLSALAVRRSRRSHRALLTRHHDPNHLAGPGSWRCCRCWGDANPAPRRGPPCTVRPGLRLERHQRQIARRQAHVFGQ